MSKFVYAYRTNPRFYLYYKYRDMRERVNGRHARGRGETGYGGQPWLGLAIEDRASFIDWAVNDASFLREWNAWAASGWKSRGPTVHRIDRDNGYVFGNMTFLNHAEKSRLHIKKREEADG